MQPGRRDALVRYAPPVVMTIGALLTLVASFATWLRSGTIERSSYDLLGLFHLLRISRIRPLRVLVRLWPLVPLLVVTAVVAAWWGKRIAAACTGIIGGAYAAAVGVAVAQKVRERYRISATHAPAWTAAGGIVLLLGSLALLALRVPSAQVQRGIAAEEGPAWSHGMKRSRN